MSTNLQKIGPALIDMDTVSQELHIKGPYIAQEQTYSPFITNYDLEVAGLSDTSVVKTLGGLPVSRIAKTSDNIKMTRNNTANTTDKYEEYTVNSNDKNLVKSTVENANRLGNEPATAYYKTVDGVKLEESIATLIERYGQEIKEVRAEHNHLMQQLAVRGSIDTYRPLAGYYDTFRTNYPLHQIGVMATARVDSPSRAVISVKPEEAELFTAGDWMVLRDKDVDDMTVYDLVSITPDGAAGAGSKGIQTNGTININGLATFPLVANRAQIYRSLGESYMNSFVFGHFSTDVASDEEIFVAGLTDDNYTITKDIKEADTGFATTFRINAALLGADRCFLSKVRIMAKKTGSPADLMCYIINANDIDKFMSPEQADEESLILAQSQPLSISNTSGLSIVEFEFNESGQYPLLENLDMNDEKTNLCMIITTSAADNRNYYTIQFLQSRDKETNEERDLQTNSVVYAYNKKNATLMAQDVFTSLNTDNTLVPYDLFHIVLARPSLVGKFSAFSEGLYSTHFETYEPMRLQNARLTMRVGREGVYYVTRTSAGNTNDVPNGGNIVVEEDVNYRNNDERMDNISGFARSVGNKIVIGTHIATVQTVNDTRISIKEGAHIEPGTPVYPMGYQAYLVCNTRYWDNASQSQKYGTPVRIPLKFTQVQPAYFESEIDVRTNMLSSTTVSDNVKYRLRDKNRVSDYLIFEGDSVEGREFNVFDLQIRWDKTSNAFPRDASFAGRIYELSVALNREL